MQKTVTVWSTRNDILAKKLFNGEEVKGGNPHQENKLVNPNPELVNPSPKREVW